MPGRMGGKRVTVLGLEVAAVDKEKKQVAIKGAVPGNKGSKIIICTANQ
jgi:large subunit ribosomal protein L3